MRIRRIQPTIAILTNIRKGLNISLAKFFAEDIISPNFEEIVLLGGYRQLTSKSNLQWKH